MIYVDTGSMQYVAVWEGNKSVCVCGGGGGYMK
jgi:hypothetical protein